MARGKKIIGYPVEVKDGRGVPQSAPWDGRVNPDCWSFLVSENPFTGQVDWNYELTVKNTRGRYGDPTGRMTVVVPTEGLGEELAFKGNCSGCDSKIESNRALLFCPHCTSSVSLSPDLAAPASVWDIIEKYGGPKRVPDIIAIIPSKGLESVTSQGGRCCACAAWICSNRKILFCPHCGSQVAVS